MASQDLKADDVPKGIAFILASTFCFAIMNVIMKLFADTYPATEITFFRQAFGLLPIIVMIGSSGGVRLLKTKRIGGHFFRSLLGNATLMLLILAYKYLPLGDVTALYYTQSLFLAALSVPLLHEKVGVHRWSAICLGLIGAVIVANPTGAFNFGALIAIAAGFIAAITMIILRQLGRTESSLTVVFYFTLFGVIFIGLAAIPVFRIPPPRDCLLMLAMGTTGGIAQYFLTTACRYAQATILAPYSYLMLVWIIAFQYLIWNDVPTGRMLTGSFFIVAGGLYILYRERKKKIAVTSVMPMLEASD
jgi:drug/metabolite transporter (DMT)-like permease